MREIPSRDRNELINPWGAIPTQNTRDMIFITLHRMVKESAQATKCMVNIENICTIREAKIEVDGEMKDGSYIVTTGGSRFYCIETFETIKETLKVIL